MSRFLPTPPVGPQQKKTASLAAVILTVAMIASIGAAEAASRDDVREKIRRSQETQPALREVPEPHVRVQVDGKLHFLSGEKFYVRVRRSGDIYYAPVRPRPGALMEGLPTDWTVMRVNGKTYFKNGRYFFKPVPRNGEVAFVLQAPPVGAWVESIPEGSRIYSHAGATYYASDNVYYAPDPAADGSRFLVVQKPS